jgi:hypothetical protein
MGKKPNDATVSLYGSVPKLVESHALLAKARGDSDAYIQAKAEDMYTSEIKDEGDRAWTNSWVNTPNALGSRKHTRYIVSLHVAEGGWVADKVEFMWDDE